MTAMMTCRAMLAATVTFVGFVPKAQAQGQAATAARTATVTAAVTAAPQQLLRQVRAGYQSLHAFSMNIEHRNSSGLYPGAFRQTLQWRKGGRFTLRATDKGDKQVPDFYADGKRVVFAFADGRQFIEKVAVTPDTMPGWEVSGGMIVSFLQKTPNSDFFFRPPQGATLTYAFGPRTRWHGHSVREILVTIARGEDKPGPPISLFVNPAAKTLTGFEWTGNGAIGYALYTDQKKNPNLPLALGQAPKIGGAVVDATRSTGAPPSPPPSLLAVGTTAPDFFVEDAAGKPLKLSDFRGKVVVLDFWATWCGPCMASLPHTNAVARKFKDKNVIVLALNVWDEKKAFAAWLPKNQQQYEALLFAIDPRGRNNDVAHTLYQVSGIPTQYVLDKDGKIVKGFVGYGGPTNDLENAIKAAQARNGAK